MRRYVRFFGSEDGPTACDGFTLIELIVTITVAGILLAVAVPAFQDLVLGKRLLTLSHETARALSLARQEAIKRGSRVSMCPSSDGAACAADGLWEQGWIVFTDPDGDGAVDAGEIVLWARGAFGGNATLRTGANFNSFVSYLPSGASRGNGGLGNGTFRLCNQRGPERGFSIVINNAGRVRIDRGVTGTCQ